MNCSTSGYLMVFCTNDCSFLIKGSSATIKLLKHFLMYEINYTLANQFKCTTNSFWKSYRKINIQLKSYQTFKTVRWSCNSLLYEWYYMINAAPYIVNFKNIRLFGSRVVYINWNESRPNISCLEWVLNKEITKLK